MPDLAERQDIQRGMAQWLGFALFGHSVWDNRHCRSETYLDISILICDLFPGLLRAGRKLVHVFQEQGQSPNLLIVEGARPASGMSA
jgi:hypothetical protein